MPGSTPNFGIAYPCVGDTFDPGLFSDWATSIENALVSVQEQALVARNRPRAAAFGTTSVAVNVSSPLNINTTTLFSHTEALVFANNIQVQRSGVYMVSAQIVAQTGATTVTNTQGNVTANTLIIQRDMSQSGPPTNFVDINVSGLVVAPAGTVISANMLWTGSGGPVNFDTTLSVAFICEA